MCSTVGAFHRYRRSYLKFSAYYTCVSSGGQRCRLSSALFGYAPKGSGIQGNCGTETFEKTRHLHRIIENEFKTRYNQHTSSFRLNHKKSATTLSEFIWKLKESKTEYHLSWDVIERAQPYSAATNRCNLCIAEKYFKPQQKKGNIFIVPP